MSRLPHTISLLILILLTLALAESCRERATGPGEGVSLALARERAARVSDIHYDLSFSIPEDPHTPCSGHLTLSFGLKDGKSPLYLDFMAAKGSLTELTVNEEEVHPTVRDEHIPLGGLHEGRNCVSARFVPSSGAMNRRPDFLYTLLVPDRARTLFPCFDQPDLKATFSLTLSIPPGWVAVSNGPAVKVDTLTDGRTRVEFGPGGLIPTYLFSFTAGVWERQTFMRGELPISIYYKETDPYKIAQIPEVFRQICHALDYMEEFTAMPLPFGKYDALLVPAFQFGGMEHPGAILLSDKRVLLRQGASTEDELSRTDLISHETAHLWFGDCVTMKWFDDVWAKEVFANYFAALVTRPLFPQVDFALKDFHSFNIPAYSEDRTEGSVPIRQRLDNLKDAGLVYGNIVYDKAPVVMRMLADTLGAERFKEGLREYLRTYAYSNATWPDLIDILDKYSDADLRSWSHIWVEEKGMRVLSPSDRPANLDALGYGYYPLTPSGIRRSLDTLSRLPLPHQRLSTLANLYENMLGGNIDGKTLSERIYTHLLWEKDPLVASSALSYLADISTHLGHPAEVESMLRDLSLNTSLPSPLRKSSLMALMGEARSVEVCEELYGMWLREDTYPGITLSPEDYTTLSYELSIRFPGRYDTIRQTQLPRISNPDRRSEFLFVFPSTNPSREVRDSVFNSLLQQENRTAEPWVRSSLRYLNHHLRQEEALGYIVPALDEMEEIQRTGDIFFPKNWAGAVLAGHDSPQASRIVKKWIDDKRRDYPPLLMNKILISSDRLLKGQLSQTVPDND